MGIYILIFAVMLFLSASAIMKQYRESPEDDEYQVMSRMPLQEIQKVQLLMWSAIFFFFASFFYGG